MIAKKTFFVKVFIVFLEMLKIAPLSDQDFNLWYHKWVSFKFKSHNI